jgi:hypothetical protein
LTHGPFEDEESDSDSVRSSNECMLLKVLLEMQEEIVLGRLQSSRKLAGRGVGQPQASCCDEWQQST